MQYLRISHWFVRDLSLKLGVRCFKEIWKVGKVGNVGKVGKVGKVGEVGKVGREGLFMPTWSQL